LLWSDKIDRRKKFFQEFQKRGVTVEFKALYDNQIPAFLRDQLNEAGRSMTEDAVMLFCRRLGTNLQEISGELEKLFAFCGERTLIDVEDVRQIVSDVRSDSIFQLTDALGQRHRAEAVRLLERLLAEGEAPLGLLSMMVRHFRQLWKVRELLDQGAGAKDLPAKVGVNPYFIQGLIAQARHFPPQRFRLIFEEFLEADLALKSSGAHPSAILGGLVLRMVGDADK
jgi:DNA polymerase III subunit delta